MKLQESDVRAQVQQQKVVNTLDITAAATFTPGNLAHIFIPQAATSHPTHYSGQLLHCQRAQPSPVC